MEHARYGGAAVAGLVIAAFAAMVSSASLGEDPPGCERSLPIVVLEPRVEGDVISTDVLLFQASETGCSFAGGQVSMILPDGEVVAVAGYRGTPPVPTVSFDLPPEVATVDYVIDPADVDASGSLVFRAAFGPTPMVPGQEAGEILADPPGTTGGMTVAIPVPVSRLFGEQALYDVACIAAASPAVTVVPLVDGVPATSVSEGDVLGFQVMMSQPWVTGCSYVGGQLSVTLPNEHAVRVAGFGGPTPDVPMIETGVGIVTVLEVPMQYVATAADAEDGVLKVQADYGATPLRPDQENGVYLTQPPLPEASRTAVTSVTFNAAP